MRNYYFKWVFYELRQQFQSFSQNAKPYITMNYSFKPLLDSIIVVKICFSICTMTLQGSLYYRNRKKNLSSEFACGLLWKQEVVVLTGGSVGKSLFPFRIIVCTLDSWGSYHSLPLIWNWNIVLLKKKSQFLSSEFSTVCYGKRNVTVTVRWKHWMLKILHRQILEMHKWSSNIPHCQVMLTIHIK